MIKRWLRGLLLAVLLVCAVALGGCAALSSGGEGALELEPVATGEADAGSEAAASAPVPSPTEPQAEPTVEAPLAGRDPAPPFPTDVEWLNTERPLSLEQLRGKVVLLDFWTYGCINCMHIIPDLKRLEAKYEDELVVIGVHSAKFDTEKESDNIRQIILRYGLEHPVINDRRFEVWRQYGAEAWPTLVLIDPAGNLVGQHSGEQIFDLFDRVIGDLVDAFDARDRMDRTPLALKLEREGLPETVLSFPGKVLADAASNRLFIADTNHNRIVVADAQSGEVQQLIGSGARGFDDGTLAEASFAQPQGLALDRAAGLLYVADTGNHALRRVALDSGTVETIAGTGAQPERYPGTRGPGKETALNSPWDVQLIGDFLYIAMAGSHQLWQMDLASGQVAPFLGSGREALINGANPFGALNQPSGLTANDDQNRLFVADSEASAIRWASLGASPEVGTIVGTGLFDFGDVDGVGSEARLQHPLGIAFRDGLLYVADTYNHKIKTVNPETREVHTLLGGGAGWRDGAEPLFYEPGGLSIAGDLLYVADTNNHSIRVVDLTTLDTRTLTLKGMERFLAMGDEEGFRGDLVTLEPLTVGAGQGELLLDVKLPAGYKVNDLAPFGMAWQVKGGAVTLAPDADRSIVAPTFPLTIPASFAEGEGTLTGDLTLYYCEDETAQICLIQQVRLQVPLRVVGAGEPSLRVDYAIPVPDLDN